jgi:hypothetical protein
MGKITDFFRRLLHYPIKKKKVVHEPTKLGKLERSSSQSPQMARRPAQRQTSITPFSLSATKI